ncbi:MAG: thioesterase [Bryobacterales bacterium]|nr:thioesterase [Bryobacterales bacterium]
MNLQHLSGTAGEEHRVVTSDMAISFIRGEEARVLSTPQLILAMEITARNSIFGQLPDGYDSLGTEVCIRHLAAAPIGALIVCRSTVQSVANRQVNFVVEAWHKDRKLAEGTHQRTVIHVERFAERLKNV